MPGSEALPVTLQPISDTGEASWPSAIWVGEIDDQTTLSGLVGLDRSKGYARARVLVRHGRSTRGFVEVAVVDGLIDGDDLARRISALAPAPPPPARPSDPPISLLICTRSRPDALRSALTDALALGYSNYEVLVVDNGPENPSTRLVVEEFDDPRLRRVEAPIQGLARARNVGLLAAAHDIVAFTDDDVVVDRWWLDGIADGFARGEKVACVSGIVPTVEIGSSAEWYFDSRFNWADSCTQDVFAAAQKRAGEPLFPFRVGRYGTGANFAVRRDAMLAIGGFDEGFGVGSPTGGGEDIDMFVRVLLAGYELAFEPAAVIWHKHRADTADLKRQIADYGLGLGAWLTKLIVNPKTLVMILRRLLPALLYLARLTKVESPQTDTTHHELFADVGKIERSGIIRGPYALWRARRSGGRARPLLGLNGTGADVVTPKTAPEVPEVPDAPASVTSVSAQTKESKQS
ncbi:glycosyl transferase family 2 [Jatrophihabitans sp. GAS493]|uniref:glycosyltransferase family 2 protein n=1 Tax=Jatrophihabitans sp. GAS493 TaxID=1907575 RepID=UPI000BB8AB4E|nr:glycosyltransferase [Jatrophihabitans sp. GAS493]SOD71585.1 glycosyl transferase family 2 [Jatrophihabitans sp. GAS493]